MSDVILYTFAEYMEDFIVNEPGFAVNVHHRELLVAWDLYSDSYIAHCKREGYEYETI